MKKILIKSNLRQKSQVILIIMLIAISPNLHAQSLIERLGGVKTDFQFTTDSLEMPIIDQVIIKRGVSDYNYNDVGDSGYGYGYGLQTLHLEFITKSAIIERQRSDKRERNSLYEIKLMDKKGALLLIRKLKLRELLKVSNGDDLFTYSINLKKIPMVLLNKTKTINIDKIRRGKK